MEYKELKFKCGLEIHQQLRTSKLFCNCPSVLRQDNPDFEVKRRLHTIAGEGGEIDIAAKYQASLDKAFIYQGYNDTTCLVELDEEPPHEINKESLKIALQIALLMNCTIQPLTQIMRKTVINGSNTSGFQRTVIIARDGYIDTSEGRVGIDSVFLEEDSARQVERKKDVDIWRLDRLGIPLVEIATAPDIKSPEQAKEAALKIGDILRSCKVRRGIGTIRQDINMSIKNGNRVEIKGMQDMKMFIKTVNIEIERQLGVIKGGKKVEKEVRNALPGGMTEFLRPMPGSARMYPETDLPLLKISRDLINDAKRTLPKLKSVVEKGLRKQGLNEDMIILLFRQGKLEEFKDLLNIVNNPILVAKALLMYPKEIAKRNKISSEVMDEKINQEVIGMILTSLKKKKIQENDIKQVMDRILLGKSIGDALKIKKADSSTVEKQVLDLIKSKPGLTANAYMGLVMKEFKGQVDGKLAMEIIRKYSE